jgi:Flp pilus assembly protein TadD
VHVPALKEILDSLGPEEAVAWARAAVRKANIRHLQQRYLFDWLADALDRVGQTEAAARERQRAQWHWECHHHPVVDNPERPLVQKRGRRGDQGGYLEVAQRAVQELPGNPYWLSGYGGSVSTVLLRMGRAQEAIAPARKALEIEPEDPFLYESLATILLFAGDPQEAERVIRQAIAFDNDIGSFHSVLGESLMRQRRPREAIDTYREAVRLEPDDPHLVRKLGMSLLRAGDLTAAEVTFRQAIPMRSEAGPHIELSDALARQGRLPEAIAAVEAAVALEPTNPHWHNRLAHVLLQTGRLAEAEAAARAAIAHDSGRSAFQDTLALILQRQGRNEEALEAMQQPAELEPKDAQLRLRMARTLLGQGQFAEAEAAAGQAAELQPDMVEAYDLLSVIMERQKRPAEAAAAAQRAAALVPQDSGRQQRLAVTLIHADDFTGAERAAREAMRLAAGQPTFHAHHLLGIAFERQGRMQEASAAARKASDLEPDNPALLGRLAAMLRAADRVEEAEFAARKAVSLQPDAEPLQRLLAAIIDQRRTLAQSAQEPAATNAPPTGQLSREPEAAEPQQETANANASPSEALAEDARLALEHAAPGEP